MTLLRHNCKVSANNTPSSWGNTCPLLKGGCGPGTRASTVFTSQVDVLYLMAGSKRGPGSSPLPKSLWQSLLPFYPLKSQSTEIGSLNKLNAPEERLGLDGTKFTKSSSMLYAEDKNPALLIGHLGLSINPHECPLIPHPRGGTVVGNYRKPLYSLWPLFHHNSSLDLTFWN